MKLVALTIAAAVGGGCVTTAAVVKPHEVPLPLLIGAAVADFVVVTAIASQVQDYTPGASVGTGLAVTAVDVGIGCVLGACKSLKP